MKAKESIKNIASKIGVGICYGIGICLAVIACFYVFEIFDFDKEEYKYAEEIDKEQLVIQDHKLIINEENRVEVIGSMQNNSDFEWSGVKLEVEFYDKNENFVYECHDKIKGKILPFQNEYFKFECSSCGKSIPNFMEYKIKIIDAYGRKLND